MLRNFFLLILGSSSCLFPISNQAQSPESAPYPVVIIGGGIGGLTAAVYLARAEMAPLVIEGPLPGGALAQSHSVQNWPGEMDISGAQLVRKVRDQAQKNGAQFLQEKVVRIDLSQRPFVIETRSLIGVNSFRQIRARTCILAMGAEAIRLGISGEDEYWDRGVSNCVSCDGPRFKGKRVAVVGGGDAAALEALQLAKLAQTVDVFVRRGTFRATVDRKRIDALNAMPNVNIHFFTTLEEIQGDENSVHSIVVKQEGKCPEKIAVDGVFLAIGSKPNTQLVKGQIELDDLGFIVLKEGTQTSVEGVYAVGDSADPVYRQAVSAAGDGARAALVVVEKETQIPFARQVVDSDSEQGSVVHIASLEQFYEELKSPHPVVVDFYATWCPPCQMISPLFESSASHHRGKMKFLKVDVDQFSELCDQYEILSMPTVLLFEKGKETRRCLGPAEISQLLSSWER